MQLLSQHTHSVLHTLCSQTTHVQIRWFIKTYPPTCCLQLIPSVLLLSQTRLDSTIRYNLVSWQRRQRERQRQWEREKESVSFWPILLAIFPVKQVWAVVQRQPGSWESQALFKWCYHNTFVSTPSVSLTHPLTHTPHPPLSFNCLCLTINIKRINVMQISHCD